MIKTVFEDLEKLPERSAAPIETASQNTRDAIARLADELGGKLKESGDTLTGEEKRLSSSAAGVREALSGVEQRLREMQTPEGIIEIRLQPFISSLTKSINSFSAIAERQATAEKEQREQFNAVVSELQSGISALAERIATMTANTSSVQKTVVDQLSAVEALQRGVLTLLEQRQASANPDAGPALSVKSDRGWFSRGTPNVRP